MFPLQLTGTDMSRLFTKNRRVSNFKKADRLACENIHAHRMISGYRTCSSKSFYVPISLPTELLPLSHEWFRSGFSRTPSDSIFVNYYVFFQPISSGSDKLLLKTCNRPAHFQLLSDIKLKFMISRFLKFKIIKETMENAKFINIRATALIIDGLLLVAGIKSQLHSIPDEEYSSEWKKTSPMSVVIVCSHCSRWHVLVTCASASTYPGSIIWLPFSLREENSTTGQEGKGRFQK